MAQQSVNTMTERGHWKSPKIALLVGVCFGFCWGCVVVSFVWLAGVGFVLWVVGFLGGFFLRQEVFDGLVGWFVLGFGGVIHKQSLKQTR